MEPKVVLDELNKHLPDGFRAVDSFYPKDTKSLMSLVKEARYEIILKYNLNFKNKIDNINNNLDFSTNEIVEIESLFKQDTIEMEKETKSKQKIKVINIKEYIIEIRVIEDNTYVETENTLSAKIMLHCKAGSENNLNPNLIIEAIKKYLPEISIEDYDIHRKELFIG